MPFSAKQDSRAGWARWVLSCHFRFSYLLIALSDFKCFLHHISYMYDFEQQLLQLGQIISRNVPYKQDLGRKVHPRGAYTNYICILWHFLIRILSSLWGRQSESIQIDIFSNELFWTKGRIILPVVIYITSILRT